jgi:hypothetical protein
MKVGDRFAGLAFKLGEKTGHVLSGVPLLFRLGERVRERYGESVEPLQEALHQLGRNAGRLRHNGQFGMIGQTRFRRLL